MKIRRKNSSAKERFTHLINSKISGFSFSLTFIRSLMAVTIELALSSAPCFELFSAAPELISQLRMERTEKKTRDIYIELEEEKQDQRVNRK